ncbi:hypothetical protein ACFODO_19160 [Acinetobacter sichuanensis]|uniref:Uncharacterized protein n=1 Tax=Acinetobacter sichuanensis TaxID=2136183 RepID=A0A371YIN5_9GAMM|nr:hypothetical protein [Acinetobacter sichuanensis]RFC81337.1 hypothetical protein C9E89_022415 [Acinetobacter sichuanensis]
MTGVEQVLVQGEISTFSGALGGAAYTANMLMFSNILAESTDNMDMIIFANISKYKEKLGTYINNSDNPAYNGKEVTLDTFSNIIAQYDLIAIKNLAESDPTSTGYLDDRGMLKEAINAWTAVGIPELFPGNLLDAIYYALDAITGTKVDPVENDIQALATIIEISNELNQNDNFSAKNFWDKVLTTGSQYAVVAAFLGRFFGKELMCTDKNGDFNLVN